MEDRENGLCCNDAGQGEEENDWSVYCVHKLIFVKRERHNMDIFMKGNTIHTTCHK